MKFKEYQLTQKGVNYILNPKRGKFCPINPDIACTITTHMNSLIGNFISTDIVFTIPQESTLGGGKPTLIYQVNGDIVSYDGKEYTIIGRIEDN